jgi:hypothetical protein
MTGTKHGRLLMRLEHCGGTARGEVKRNLLIHINP